MIFQADRIFCLRSRIADTIVYNDENRDGEVSFDELYASTWQWNVLSEKQRQLRRAQTVKDVKEIELAFLKRFRCEDLGEEACAKEAKRIKSVKARSLKQFPIFRAPEEEEQGRDEL